MTDHAFSFDSAPCRDRDHPSIRQKQRSTRSLRNRVEAELLCLNLAAHAIIASNTVYMAEALDVLRTDGFAVDDNDLAHVPPTLWTHVKILESTSSMLRPAPIPPRRCRSPLCGNSMTGQLTGWP